MEKVLKYIQRVCEAFELLAAALVLIGIALSVYSLLKDFTFFLPLLELGDVTAFREYMEKIFIIVIGIEFVGMLCRPTSDNVLEVLIFLVARHTIVGDTTPYEDFVSVISIAILCILRWYLHEAKAKKGLPQ